MDEREVQNTSRVGETNSAQTADQAPSAKVTAPVGAAAGAVAAGTIGTIILGPLGTVIGAIAGAVGGGWLGLAEGRAAQSDVAAGDESEFRSHFEETRRLTGADVVPGHTATVTPGEPAGTGAHTYEAARPAYVLGHMAALNPDYRGKSFDQIESDLRLGWSDEVGARYGDWSTMRAYARAGYERGTRRDHGETVVANNLGGTITHQRASFSDPAPRYENAVRAADTVGPNAPGSDPVPGAGTPEWMDSPVDQGGGGAHMEPDHSRRAEPWTEMDRPQTNY